MEETLYERINRVCKARGKTPSGLCVELGIRKGIMSELKSGHSKSIRTDTLVLFADALGVSTDYLLTGRELRFTPEESSLLNAWRQATLQEKQNVAFVLRDYGMPMPTETPEARDEVV